MNRRKFLVDAGTALFALAAGGSTLARPKQQQPAVDQDLFQRTVNSLATGVRSKEFSAFELVSACLEQIERVNPWLNAVVTLDAESALRQARHADTMLARGDVLGPLHGIPMTIKDSLDTKNMRTSWGVPSRVGFVPERDATAVARLKAAGAILLGKTNTPELTLSFETNNPVHGTTNNPYDIERTSGGSSGGAAAIVSAGGSPFDIGSDTGGSLRVPAHFCGVSSVRPTSGRVPRTGNAVPPGGLLDPLTSIGPVARSVSDLELILRIIAGPDGQDPSAKLKSAIGASHIRISELTAAFHTDNGLCKASLETIRAVEKTAHVLAEAGVKIVQSRPGEVEQTLDLFLSLLNWGNGNLRRSLMQRANEAVPLPAMKAPKQLSQTTTKLLRRWTAFRAHMQNYMKRYDLIICPVNAYPALIHGKALDEISAFSYTMTYSLTDWPAAVIRAGTSPEGLPIGIQIVAAPWRENVVLKVAKYLEGRFGGWPIPQL